MRRSASASAMSVIDGGVIPAPAPCANTKQRSASSGASSRPETRGLSSAPTGIGDADRQVAKSEMGVRSMILPSDRQLSTALQRGRPVKYKGSCHCGRVAYEVEGTVDTALSCNCSICRRKGSLLWFTARENLRLTTPEENASTYEFNKHPRSEERRVG